MSIENLLFQILLGMIVCTMQTQTKRSNNFPNIYKNFRLAEVKALLTCIYIYDICCFFSVAVSACDGDGGVHAAFRSLLRFLLQKKMPKKMKKEQNENSNLKNIFGDPNQHGTFARNLASIDDHSYKPLKITRIPEVFCSHIDCHIYVFF